MVRVPMALRREISERHRSGQSNIDIQRELSLGRAAVERWIAEGEERLPCWGDQHRPGRPPKLSKAQVKAVRRAGSSKRTATAVAKALTARWGCMVGRTLVSRVWHSGRRPLSYRKNVKRKCLSPINQQKRQKFGEDCRPTPRTPWAFTDGKVLSLYSDGSGQCTNMSWQHDDEPAGTTGRGRGKLIARFFVYAVVGKGLKSRLIFTAPSPKKGSGRAKGHRAFNGEDYVALMKLLKRELDRWRPSGRYLLIRDRASQHVSRASTRAMTSLGLPILESFPPQSWDVNAIEYVWGQLVLQLNGHRARTPDGYRRVIVQAWERISQATIDEIVAGVSERLDKIVAIEGLWPSPCKNDL